MGSSVVADVATCRRVLAHKVATVGRAPRRGVQVSSCLLFRILQTVAVDGTSSSDSSRGDKLIEDSFSKAPTQQVHELVMIS
jgi:hypothetical protein